MNYEQEAREIAQGIIGANLSDGAWGMIWEPAKRKLRHIITHFGDDGGERRKPYYIAQLAVEAGKAIALTESLKNKRGTAQAG